MMTRHFQQLPKAYVAYPKLMQAMLKKNSHQPLLPELEYVVDQLQIDAKHLRRYQNLTGFATTQQVPALYMAMLSQSLQMHMMTQEAFPFAILGLVHIRNQVKQLRKIGVNEQLSLSCKFGDLKPHDKGV